ncbi:MAG: hypothetical protein IKV91_07930 [Bacteroidales bacterium]|nr:hypothetical protein [Bacteroidales bacterium]
MKRLFTMLAIATALTLSWSCEKDPVKEENKENTGNEEQKPGGETTGGTVDTITAALENSPVKTVWAEGDAILVYAIVDGADVAAKYVLSAGAGTATGTFVPSASAVADNATGYFATYPYNEDMTFAQHNTFAYTMEAEQAAAAPVFAYAENASNLTFKSAAGAVKIPLTGKGGVAKVEVTDNDAKAILNGNVTYNPKTTKFAIKNSAASKNMVTMVLAEKVELGETAIDFTVEVPAGAFKTGGVMVLYDVNNSPLANINIPNLTVEAGKTVAMETQNVVPVAQTVNLNSAQGYANTYQIQAVGKYKFETVKGNDSAARLDAASVEVTWETWCNSETVTQNSLVKSVALEDGYVVFEAADPFHAGNALVSVKNAEGTIIWSWMLWFVEEKIGTIEVDGYQFMDRNLGALTTDKAKPGLNYGLLWQWGRIAPVMGLDGTHTGTAMTSYPADVTTTVERSAEGTNWPIEYGIANPTVFLYGNTPDNGYRHWADDLTVEAGLWGETKTIYDPCPAGYKVMSFASSQVLFADLGEGAEADDVNKGITANGFWFPYTGYWKYSSSSRSSDADNGFYWSSTHQIRDEEIGYYCVAKYSKISSKSTSYDSKGSAMAIRCEVDSVN